MTHLDSTYDEREDTEFKLEELEERVDEVESKLEDKSEVLDTDDLESRIEELEKKQETMNEILALLAKFCMQVSEFLPTPVKEEDLR